MKVGPPDRSVHVQPGDMETSFPKHDLELGSEMLVCAIDSVDAAD